MFSNKAFKHLQSNAWYLWCFHVKTVKDIETESTITLPDTTKTNFTLMKLLRVNTKLK